MTRAPMTLGWRVYGLGVMALGIVCLALGDFDPGQPVPKDFPFRAALAYAAGAFMLVAGAAIEGRRTTAWGAAALTAYYVLVVVILMNGRVVLARYAVYGTYSGIAEQLAIAAAALIVYANSAGIDAALAARLRRMGQLTFAVCALLFGGAHFVYLNLTAPLVPRWLPADAGVLGLCDRSRPHRGGSCDPRESTSAPRCDPAGGHVCVLHRVGASADALRRSIQSHELVRERLESRIDRVGLGGGGLARAWSAPISEPRRLEARRGGGAPPPAARKAAEVGTIEVGAGARCDCPGVPRRPVDVRKLAERTGGNDTTHSSSYPATPAFGEQKTSGHATVGSAPPRSSRPRPPFAPPAGTHDAAFRARRRDAATRALAALGRAYRTLICLPDPHRYR